MPVLWVPRERLIEVLTFLRQVPKPYVMLYDLHGVDERLRTHRRGLPSADFSVFYHLMSLERNSDVMIKVALSERDLNLPTATRIWPNANWYEREVWDMYGITFTGHPHLTRMLMPPTWQGHPLRKDYPARATEFDPYSPSAAKQDLEQEALRFAGRLGHEAPRRERGLHVPQPRPEPPVRPRRVPHHPATGRRGDHRLRPGDRLPPPRRREDGRAPVLAQFHPLHRPHRLPRRGDEQPALRTLGGEARRDQGAAAGRRDPDHDGGVLPYPEPPAVPGHLYPGRRRHDPGVLHLHRPPARLQGGRGHHRLPPAPGLVPHRRRRPRPAARLGQAGPRVPRLDAQAPRRVRDRGPEEQHPARPDHRRRPVQHRKPSSGAPPAPACAPPVATSTCARPAPTPATRTSSSRYRWPTTATPTTAAWSRWARCARACGSSNSA